MVHHSPSVHSRPQEAADCIRQMPVLSIQPWISSAVTLLVFIPGVIGFLMLNMSGDLPKQVDARHRGCVRVTNVVFHVDSCNFDAICRT